MISVRPIDVEGSWIITDPECGEEGGHEMGWVLPSKATLLYRQTLKWRTRSSGHVFLAELYRDPPGWKVKHWDEAVINVNANMSQVSGLRQQQQQHWISTAPWLSSQKYFFLLLQISSTAWWSSLFFCLFIFCAGRSLIGRKMWFTFI